MNVPDDVRERLKTLVWSRADTIGWMDLAATDKSTYYENWTSDPDVGGVLTRYIDKGQVRVYLKDSLLKDYVRIQLADGTRPFRVLNISRKVRTEESFVKPHGRRLADGRVVCWGRAEDWKAVLMALHERTHGHANARPFAAVFMRSIGRFGESKVRAMVKDAASKLGIKKVVWLEV